MPCEKVPVVVHNALYLSKGVLCGTYEGRHCRANAVERRDQKRSRGNLDDAPTPTNQSRPSRIRIQHTFTHAYV